MARDFWKTLTGGATVFFPRDGQGNEITMYDSATRAWTLSKKLFHDPGQVAALNAPGGAGDFIYEQRHPPIETVSRGGR